MIIERQAQMEMLWTGSEAALGGRGQIMFVVGEAGIGKTTLMRAFADQARETIRVKFASCEDLSTPEPLVLVRDLQPDLDVSSLSRIDLFTRLLDELSQVPTAIIIEDLHWADDASMDFLRFAARRLAERPLLIVATSRDDDQSSLSRLRRAANDIPAALRTRINLPRLSVDAVDRLAIEAGLSGPRVHELTGGNPLFVSEVLADGGRTPAGLVDLVIARANRLGIDARSALDFCSLFPRQVSATIVHAAGNDERAVEECLASGLLTMSGDDLAFRHEVTRNAVLAQLSPSKRQRLHKQALVCLQQSGASPSRLLHHAVASHDAPSVMRWAPVAGEELSAAGAHREAASAWSAILPYIDQLAIEEQERSWRLYGYELHLVQRLAEAIGAIETALALAQAHAMHVKAGDLLRFLSRLHYLNGNRQEADRYGREAIEALEPLGDSIELAKAYSNIAQLAMLTDDPDVAVENGEKAMALAMKLGSPYTFAHALNNVGSAIRFRAPDEALAKMNQALDAMIGVSDVDAEVARAHINRSFWGYDLMRHAQGIAFADEGIAYCIDRDLDVLRDYLFGCKALIELNIGRVDAAAATAALSLSNHDATPLARNPAVRAMAMIRMRAGEDGVPALVAELAGHMEVGREGPRFLAFAAIVAERAWIDGHGKDKALALIDRANFEFPRHGNSWLNGELWFWARKLGRPHPLPDTVARPYTLLGSGDLAGAAAAFEEHELPYWRALVLSEGDAPMVADAIVALGRLGAAASVAAVRRNLAKRGIRVATRGPRASTASNRFGLTRREIDVLAKLDAGLTNREIGERLFVSPKTIDHHVSSLIAKLGVRNRTEAGAMGRAEGLIGDAPA